MKLFESMQLGKVKLANRVVMAPMTRSRSAGNVPGELVAQYYGQRAGAGLIITEGVSPSPNGLGYPRIPGLFSEAQVQGWKLVTKVVHGKGGKIFAQLMHTGRVSHPANMPAGSRMLAPSAVALSGQMWTDSSGLQSYPVPAVMTEADIGEVIQEYAKSAELAIQAGFDGVELHGANGYLIEQFLNANVNKRTDGYGGTPQGRMRFALEVAKAVTGRIGGERTGMRISPYGVFNDTGVFDGVDSFYAELTRGLTGLELVYIHVVDHSSMGAPAVSGDLKRVIRETFIGAYIMSGGYDADRAERDLAENRGDLVAFGRPFIANPDLVERLRSKAPLAVPDQATFYSPGAAGYTDYK